MRAVIQRVVSADVQANGTITGAINTGLMVLLGIEEHDEQKDLDYMTDKIPNLRIFEDQEGKMNLSLLDVAGELLVVSQFTLYGDCRKGRRPGFTQAAKPEKALYLYRLFVDQCKEKGIQVQEGVFQAEMLVRIYNDGPVTMLLDSRKIF
jgi:D-tyrosyl-tRNA(Tyr) deacylase